MGRLSLSVDWENGPERGFQTVSFSSLLPVVLTNSTGPDQTPRSAASDLGLHCLPMSQFRVADTFFTNLCVSRYLRAEKSLLDCVNDQAGLELCFSPKRGCPFLNARAHYHFCTSPQFLEDIPLRTISEQ